MDQDSSKQNGMQDSSTAENGGTTSSEDDEDAVKEYISTFPPGYGFFPTDVELVRDYLMKKVNNEPLPPNVIRKVHLYSKDPPELIAENNTKTEAENKKNKEAAAGGGKEWYYFTPRDKKYPNGSRPSRSTPSGYWKPTGTDKAIPQGSRNPDGFKKALDFYIGKHPGGTKTDWKMIEYRVAASNIKSQINDKPRDQMTLDDWVLCKVYKKSRGRDVEPNYGGNGTPTGGAQNNEAGNNNQFEDENPNACQPTVDVSQCNKGGASLMAGNNNIAVSECQNSNASSRQAVDGASLMAGNNNQFEDQNPNACQPTVDVSRYNNEATLMAGNNKIVASEYHYQNTSSRQAVNGASLMAGNNYQFEDRNLNACRETVDVSRYNNEASLMAGNKKIFAPGYHYSNACSRQAVNGASFMAGNNNIVASDYQNSNAFQQAVNEASLMAGNKKIFAPEYHYWNASSGQAVNGISFMAGNNKIVASEYQNSNAFQQAVNEAFLMAGNNSNACFQQAVNGASSKARKNDIIESEYNDSNASPQQDVNAAPLMAGNYNFIGSGYHYQYSNASSSRQAVNGACLMAGNYNFGSGYQYSNASSSRQAVNGACLMAGNYNIGSGYQYSNASSSRQAVNEASLMAGNYNINGSEYQYSNASSSQQAVNGASLMAGNFNIVSEYQNWIASEQAVNGASLMAGNNNIVSSVSHYSNASSSRQDVNGVRNNEAYLMAGNYNTVFQHQNSNANEASLMAAFEYQKNPNASQPTANEAALMAANYQIEDQNSDASQPIPDHQGSMLHDEVPDDGSDVPYLINSQPFFQHQIEDLSPIRDDIDRSFFN